jgi:hypothetical protein
MSKAELAPEIELEVSDVSGQKLFAISNVPTDHTVGELLNELTGKMRLPRSDAGGAPLTYHARLEREGRHLNSSERIGDALHSKDRLTLQPNIDAGGRPEGLTRGRG